MKIFLKRTFASLRNYNYRLYFIGQAISLSGTWMQTISQDWLVLKLTNSGTALGVVTAMQFLPILLFGAWGGVIADRFSKRRILFLTQSIAGVLALILGFLVLTNVVQLWMVFVLAFILGIVGVFDNPTRQAFVFEMVGAADIQNAVTLNTTEFNLARVIGPTLAGVTIATLGMALCFFLNGFSYVAVLLILLLMHPYELHHVPRSSSMRGQISKGLKYIISQPTLLHTLIMMAIIGTLTYEFSVSLPLLSQFTFHAGSNGYAALTAALGIGSVIGGLYIAGQKKAALNKLILTALLFGIMLLMVAVSPSLSISILLMVIVGGFSLTFMSLGNVLLQLESDPQMRGRVMAFWMVAFLGTTPIGSPIIGWIGEHLGPRWAIAVGGLAAIGASLYGYLASRKKIGKRIIPQVQTTAAVVKEK